MQRYSDKTNQKSSKIYESPLLESLKQEFHMESSFSLMSSQVLNSIQLSRDLPLTLAKQKCKNCERLENCISGLINSLLSIQRNILEKQQKMNLILAEKVKTINTLQLRLENINEKNSINHLTSTFHTQTGNKMTNIPLTFPSKCLQDSKPNNSQVIDKKDDKTSCVSAYILEAASQKNRQNKQNKQLYQNMSSHLEKSVKDKIINKLQFQNQTLRNYNATLLVQMQKLKRSKTKNVCSFYEQK